MFPLSRLPASRAAFGVEKEDRCQGLRKTISAFKTSAVAIEKDPGSCSATESKERDSSCGETDGEYWRWCPRCGHELHNEKCKLRCPRCHYFMSCSDFD